MIATSAVPSLDHGAAIPSSPTTLWVPPLGAFHVTTTTIVTSPGLKVEVVGYVRTVYEIPALITET